MATWYIASTTASPAGNDANAGTTSALPKATIAAVHTAAASGDTVIVKASTGTIVWSNQTFTKTLTIQGETVPTLVSGVWTGAICDGGATTVTWQCSSNASLTVSKLIFTNATGGGTAFTLTPFSYFYVPTTGTFTMSACVVYNTAWNTFLSRPGAMWMVSANTVATFSNCVFYAPTTGTTDHLFGNNGITGAVAAPASLTVTNCVLYAASKRFANFDSGGTFTCVIKNNIWSNTSSSVALIGSAPTGIIYNNNIAFGTYTSIPSGSNNLTSDPLFVAPASGDFRLRPSSPAINTGVAV